MATELLKALSLSFAALFFVFQIRHFMNAGDMFARDLSLDELSLQVLTGLCFTLGASIIRPGHETEPTPYSKILPTLGMVVSLVTLMILLFGVCFALNPLLNEDIIVSGGYLLNSLTLAYLIPSVVLALAAHLCGPDRPKPYVMLLGGLSLFSLLIYLTAQIRLFFVGEIMALPGNPPVGWELYAISLAWLGLSILLLTAGMKTHRKDIRIASACVLLLAVFKAFFIDMAGLEGVLRALAFVVLGIVLIVIGLVYQRLLFTPRASDPSTVS